MSALKPDERVLVTEVPKYKMFSASQQAPKQMINETRVWKLELVASGSACCCHNATVNEKKSVLI